MPVIQTRYFQQVYANHVKTGGMYGRMASKAGDLINKLVLGLPPNVPTTNHGESRLKGCTKYALSDGFRLVTINEGSNCFIVYMGTHDKCDEWLERNRGARFVFDPKTNALSIVASVEGGEQRDLRPPGLLQSLETFAARIRDVDWEKIVPSRILRKAVLSLDEKDPDNLWQTISDIQADDSRLADALITAINHLRSGQTDEARLAILAYAGLAEVSTEAKPLPTELVATAARDPVNSERFVVLNDLDPEQLKLLMDPFRFQDWMVFLHEGQKRVVNEDFSKPAVFTGVSGSGKTCVLVHRAKRMARLYPEGRTLVVTLNRSLSKLLDNLINQIASVEERSRIDVMSFHEFLAGLIDSLDLELFLRTLGICTGHSEAVSSLTRRAAPQELKRLFKAWDERELYLKFDGFMNGATNGGNDEAVKLWSFLSTREGGAVDPVQYLYEEMELVRSALSPLNNYEDYLDSEKFMREGRSVPFFAERRGQVLRMLRSWEKYQLDQGFLDHMGLSLAAFVAIEDRGSVPEMFRYRCVLVDEFQDFSTVDLEILRRIPLLPENGLFLTGDLAQKIYAKELDFGKAGIGRENRTLRSIRKNYRNSRQILQAADALLRAYPPRSDGDPDLKVLDPELASRESAMPIAMQSADPVGEAWRQASEWLAAGNPGFSLCIATANPDRIPVERILERKPAEITAVPLTGEYMLNPLQVVVSDMTTIKGFEFSLIIVLGLEDGVFPYPKRPEEEFWRDALRLYVAITRGRDEVRFAYSNRPSRFLEAMREFVDWRKAEPISIDVEREIAPKPDRAPSEADALAAPALVESSPEEEPAAESANLKLGADRQDKALVTRDQAKDLESPPPGGDVSSRPTEPDATTQELIPVARPGDEDSANARVDKEHLLFTSKSDRSRTIPVAGPTRPGRLAAKTPPTPVPKHELIFLNGFPCLSIPQGLSERQLGAILAWDPKQLALAIQGAGFFSNPITPLPNHVVRAVLDQRRVLVHFYPNAS